MAYLAQLQNGLLGALQQANNPSTYLAKREQEQAQDAQNVANTYAQAAQQGKANMAQLQNQEQQMAQAGEQAIKQKEAEEAAKKKQLMQIGLAVATGGIGGGGEAGEAVADSAGQVATDEMANAAAGELEKGLIDSGALSSTTAMASDLDKFSNLANATPYRTALNGASSVQQAAQSAALPVSGLLTSNISNLGQDEDTIKNKQAGPASWMNIAKSLTGLGFY